MKQVWVDKYSIIIEEDLTSLNLVTAEESNWSILFNNHKRIHIKWL